MFPREQQLIQFESTYDLVRNFVLRVFSPLAGDYISCRINFKGIHVDFGVNVNKYNAVLNHVGEMKWDGQPDSRGDYI